MKTNEQGVFLVNPTYLKSLIEDKYGTVRNFSKKAGFTDSMVCHILHSRRKIYPWSLDVFARLLGLSKNEFEQLFCKGA